MRPFTFASLVLFSLSLGLSSSASAAPQRSQVGRILPALQKARVSGSVPASQILHLAISLQPRFPVEFQAFCDAVSDPFSPAYKHFMTPGEVGEAFGASARDQQAVIAFLRSQGMKIVLAAPNRMAILADATAAQAQAAFGTQLKRFQGLDLHGNTLSFMANATIPTIPSALSKVIVNVAGLEDFVRPETHNTTLLTPPLARGLLRTAPSYAAGSHGEGRKIAVTSFKGYRVSNLPIFIAAYGLPTPVGGAGSNVHIITVGTPSGTGTEDPEGDLDIEMELGMAPLADIYVYDTAQTVSGYISVLTQEATDNQADIISDSYGWSSLSTTDADSLHAQHMAMTAQGQTYVAGSGDSGTADLNGATRDPYPDVDPEVLVVGGTVANVDSTTGIRVAEDGWNGSGGGWCTDSFSFNTLPSWQTGTGVPVGNNHRLVPDIAIHASGANPQGSGFTYYYHGALQASWGTSFSSPVFAGCLATLEQRLAGNGQTARMGRMQNLIYGENGRADIWRDITTGANGALPDLTASTAHTGWDFVTGWGAPDFDAWFTALMNKSVTGTVTLQNLAAAAVAGRTVTLEFMTAGTSTVVDTKVAVLDASGNFATTTQLPVGSYDVYAKASHWLRRKLAGVSITGAGASGLVYSLLNGDVNGNNNVSLVDFSLLRSAFNTVSGDPNWNPEADLNGDGTVSLSDFSILRTNFNAQGD